MIFLIDHNIEGQAEMLWGNIAAEGWLELLPIRFICFEEIDLPIDSNDRTVWKVAQSKGMILLTANRSMKGEDSLEQVIREENGADSLPVVTVGNPGRLLSERAYRNRCADEILAIAIDFELYMGVGRLFIP
ncbi:MAG: ACP S-malonyltransferase [Cyanobacteria bacterium J06639_1]